MTSLRDSALSGIRWTLGARLTLQLVSWPITLISIRLLDPKDYGVLALSMIVLGVASLIGDIGFGVTMVQVKRLSDEAARSASGLILFLSLVLASALVWMAPAIARWFNEPTLAPVVRVISVDLLITALAALPQIQLERQLRFRDLSIAMLAAGICGVLVTLVGALLGCGVWALVAGTLAASVVRSGLQIKFFGGLVIPSLRLTAVRPHVGRSSHVIGSRALWYWYTQADQIILGRMLHTSALGSFNVASQLAMLPVTKAMDTINRVAFPTLSRLQDQGSAPIGNVHVRMLGMTAMYGFGVCWALAAISNNLIPLMLGSHWQLAAEALALLGLVAPLRMMCALQNTIATAAGSPQAVTKELFLASAIVPVSVWIGAATGNMLNAARAWVIAYPIVYLASTWLTARAVHVNYLSCLRPILAPLASAILMVSVITGIEIVLEGNVPIGAVVLVSIVLGPAVYCLSMFVLASQLVRDAALLSKELTRPRAVNI